MILFIIITLSIFNCSNDLKCKVAVHFDIGGIVDHHFLNFHSINEICFFFGMFITKGLLLNGICHNHYQCLSRLIYKKNPQLIQLPFIVTEKCC